MNLKSLLMGAAVVALIVTAGCKPSETAYREAYRSAVAARDAALGADSASFIPIRPNMKQTVVAQGTDTISATYIPVLLLNEGGATLDKLRRYSLVVGQFKQVFNAKQMRRRISERGYPGAIIVRSGEPLYYVIASSTDSVPSAARALRDVHSDTLFRFHSPLPFILSRKN